MGRRDLLCPSVSHQGSISDPVRRCFIPLGPIWVLSQGCEIFGQTEDNSAHAQSWIQRSWRTWSIWRAEAATMGWCWKVLVLFEKGSTSESPAPLLLSLLPILLFGSRHLHWACPSFLLVKSAQSQMRPKDSDLSIFPPSESYSNVEAKCIVRNLGIQIQNLKYCSHGISFFPNQMILHSIVQTWDRGEEVENLPQPLINRISEIDLVGYLLVWMENLSAVIMQNPWGWCG